MCTMNTNIEWLEAEKNEIEGTRNSETRINININMNKPIYLSHHVSDCVYIYIYKLALLTVCD